MPNSRRAGFLRLLSVAAIVVLAALLAGCTAPTDPMVVHESLAEVTEEPAPPQINDEYSAELHPEPIVDPLECAPYLVLTVRGTGEPSKRQLLAPVVRSIAKAQPNLVEHVDVDYPADTDVQEGGALGVRFIVDTLNLQADACPEQQTVLLGYSQGALIIGDALDDPEFRLVGQTAGEITEHASTQIAAIVMYGNPRFVGAEAYNFGTYNDQSDGILPRPPGSLIDYAFKLRDFCVDGDFICQRSFELDDEGHIAYYENGMQQEGADFVLSMLPEHSDETDPERANEKPESKAPDSNALNTETSESETLQD